MIAKAAPEATVPAGAAITVAAARLVADCAGALYWPEEGLLALADLRRLGDLLRRAKGRIDYRRLDRISPLAVPILLEIGKERVLDGTAEDELLDIAAQELIEEATRL